jgi:uncharacterized membrane protein YphA (DoxX/SURF4 family)
MGGVSWLCSVLLAATLAYAGIAKLRRPGTTAAGFAALGLPAPDTLARAVPVVELAVAAALVLVPRAGAAVALVLLLGFTAVLARVVVRGETVSCGCFGTARREPVSVVDLARNGLLAVAAAIVLVVSDPTTPDLADVVLVTTVVALGLVLLALLDLRRTTGGIWRMDLETGPK